MLVFLINSNYSFDDSCDELPTSLVYLDTSVNPHKLLGHVQIKKFVEENALELNSGKF